MLEPAEEVEFPSPINANGHGFISSQQIKQRPGWTVTTIRQLLPSVEATTVSASGYCIHLWSLDTVRAAEDQDAFSKALARWGYTRDSADAERAEFDKVIAGRQVANSEWQVREDRRQQRRRAQEDRATQPRFARHEGGWAIVSPTPVRTGDSLIVRRKGAPDAYKVAIDVHEDDGGDWIVTMFRDDYESMPLTDPVFGRVKKDLLIFAPGPVAVGDVLDTQAYPGCDPRTPVKVLAVKPGGRNRVVTKYRKLPTEVRTEAMPEYAESVHAQATLELEKVEVLTSPGVTTVFPLRNDAARAEVSKMLTKKGVRVIRRWQLWRNPDGSYASVELQNIWPDAE